MDDVSFDPIRLLRELSDAGVRFVVIGGIAARAMGSPLVTADLDLCYARDRRNLEALAAMLRTANARLRGVEGDVPFRVDAMTIEAGDAFTFETDFGALDILGTPAGTSGYDDLVRSAVLLDVDGLSVRVAAIDDLIRMKRATGRVKDLLAIEELGALREELDAGR